MDKKTIVTIVAVVIALLMGIAIGGYVLPGREVTVTVTTPSTILQTVYTTYTTVIPTTVLYTTTVAVERSLLQTILTTSIVPTTIATTIITTVPTTKPVTETITQLQTLTTVVEKISIVDALGRSIEFEDIPKRVVSTMPSITEILFALGLGDRVVGVTTYCNYPPEVPKLVEEGKIQTVGGPWTLDLEKIVALKPDLVLLSVSPHVRLKDKFDEYGLKTVFLKSNTAQNIYEIYSDIMLVAKIFRVEDRAQSLIDEMDAKLNSITSKLVGVTKPRVLHLVGPPSWGLYSAGGNTFIGWLIETAGGVNIARQYTGWPRLDYEFILSQDPEVIVITVHDVDPNAIYNEIINTPITETSAWKNGRVYLLLGEADDVLSRPGPRIVEALDILAHIIHPEIFGEIQRADVVNIARVSATPIPTPIPFSIASDMAVAEV
ncbi:periplasmic binding protein [Ignisphaera aggregans DSM 17230]|uniref:Periplasmic binding protein n=1 Tax=Ignisphaera aggregans (strain DSM 17230 / JCM 13409 / AQ1.S1) TaxID=583356 RepID=E0SSG3_IGNAA|nr:periplasmic binding protein [Ignisphaera aggregans DSM 17230]